MLPVFVWSSTNEHQINWYFWNKSLFLFAGNKPILQRQFRREIVKELVSTQSHTRKRGRQPLAPLQLTRLVDRHFLDVNVNEEGKNMSRVCVVCSEGRRRMEEGAQPAVKRRCGRQTIYKCVECDVPLCVTPCMKIYHTQKDYVTAYIRHVSQ